MMNTKIFVYGTLQKGKYWHNSYLKDSEFLGNATTTKDYSLYVIDLPYMIKNPSESGVQGELYNVDMDTLSRIDRLEGHPTMYKRQLIDVFDDNGKKVSVNAYIFPSSPILGIRDVDSRFREDRYE